MREVEGASKQVAELQAQLEAELGRLAEQEDDLLPRYGLTREAVAAGAKPTADVAGAAAPQARESLERFRKLCRDAKRRAIGAG